MRPQLLLVLFASLILNHGTSPGQQPTPGKPVAISKVALRDGKTLVGLVEEDTPKLLRLLDLKTNQISEIKRADITEGPAALSDDDAYKSAPAENIVAARVTRSIPRVGGTGKIASVDGGVIYVTLGSSHGLTDADRLSVYRGEQVIRDPDSGEVLGKQRRLVANLQPQKIDEKLTKAKLIGDLETELQVGDAVEFSGKSMVMAVIPATEPDGTCPQGALKLADLLTTRLTEGGTTIVERTKLADVIVELALSSTQLFDSEQTQKIGKQLGATAVLTGKVIREGNLSRTGQVSLRLVDVATGKVLFATSYKAYPFDFAEGTSPFAAGAAVIVGEGKKSDLLKSVQQVAPLSVKGTWSLSDGVLTNTAHRSVFEFPTDVKGSYQLYLELRRRGAETIIVTLPVGNRSVYLDLGAENQYHGLSFIRGAHSANNKTRRRGTLPDDRRSEVKANVRINGDGVKIIVFVEGAEVIDWSGKIADLSTDNNWTPSKQNRIGIAALRSTVEVRKAEIR
jgi:TolB-like protein